MHLQSIQKCSNMNVGLMTKLNVGSEKTVSVPCQNFTNVWSNYLTSTCIEIFFVLKT